MSFQRILTRLKNYQNLLKIFLVVLRSPKIFGNTHPNIALQPPIQYSVPLLSPLDKEFDVLTFAPHHSSGGSVRQRQGGHRDSGFGGRGRRHHPRTPRHQARPPDRHTTRRG